MIFRGAGERRRSVAGHFRPIQPALAVSPCPLRPEGDRNAALPRNDAMGHVWTAPGWQEESSLLRRWSERPCVRPVCAVRMTAGHNALRGSGHSQKHAIEDAMAHVGCPNRRIDPALH